MGHSIYSAYLLWVKLLLKKNKIKKTQQNPTNKPLLNC